MNVILQEYMTLFVLAGLAALVSLLLFFVSVVLNLREVEIEKISAYECGFDPFEDTRSVFDVRFYLIGILFMIFDLEIMYLFPWSLSLKYTHVFGFNIMMVFLLILLVGYIYEWKKGALDW
jgi:NADH:ubiquinone oxidoreductase subunit 3 (subunit A)